jgi:hypothetical protein
MLIFYILAALILIGLIYAFILRPWHLKWGALENELKISYPGDNIVQNPDFNAIRGITINASPSDIWRWIIQIGSKRAGWYSIDWMDNAGVKSSERILPEYQQISIGQFIPFTPDQKNGMWVKEFKEYEYILWIDKAGKATWVWFLIPSGQNSTRLITKLRTKYSWTSLWIIYYLIYDFGDIIMMAKCLKGIKERAEKNNT